METCTDFRHMYCIKTYIYLNKNGPIQKNIDFAKNEPARKMFQIFRNYTTSTVKKAIISTLIRFGAIMSDTIRSFSTLLESYWDWINLELCTIKAPPHNKSKLVWTCKFGSILHENARWLIGILLVAASNLLCHSFQVFEKFFKTLDDPLKMNAGVWIIYRGHFRRKT